MRHLKLDDAYLLRLDTDEEIFSGIAAFAADMRVDAAAISAIGAAHHVVLGYYDRPRRTYLRKTYEEEMEILALTGNIALKEGKAFPHLHCILSGRDFATVGGHFFEGIVGGTCEAIVTPFRGYMQRKFDEATGLFLIDI